MQTSLEINWLLKELSLFVCSSLREEEARGASDLARIGIGGGACRFQLFVVERERG